MANLNKIQLIINRPDEVVHNEKNKCFSPGQYLYIQLDNPHRILGAQFHVFRNLMKEREVQYIPQFALYPYSKNTWDGVTIDLIQVIRILKGKSLELITSRIQKAQTIGDLPLKRKLKERNLPYITHSGVFIPRRNSGLVQPGFTYQLDIDKISNAGEILKNLIADPELEVMIALKSVSGNGVKAILFLRDLLFLRDQWNYEQYSLAYHQVTDILVFHFRKYHGVEIDRQMKAISQPFFLFHSPDLFISKNLAEWI